MRELRDAWVPPKDDDAAKEGDSPEAPKEPAKPPAALAPPPKERRPSAKPGGKQPPQSRKPSAAPQALGWDLGMGICVGFVGFLVESYRRFVYDQTEIPRNRNAPSVGGFTQNPGCSGRVLFGTFGIFALLESRNSGLVITEPTVVPHPRLPFICPIS